MTRTILLAGAAGMALLAAGNVALGTNISWPQTNHDAGRTGFNQEEAGISASNVASLQMLWGQGVPDNVTSFALNKGTLFVQSKGSGSSVLTALSGNKGAIRWQVNTGNDGGGNAGIATDSAGIYAGCAQTDSVSGTPDGAMCAYDPSTGAVRWVYCVCNSGGGAGVISPLTYDRGVIYFGYSYLPWNGASGQEQFVVAVDAASGTELWMADLGASNGPGSLGGSPVTAGAGDVYVSCAVGSSNRIAALCALSEADGSLVWDYPLNAVGSGLDDIGMAVSKNTLYAHIDGAAPQMVALNTSTGNVLWSKPWSNYCCGAPPPAIAGALLYVPVPTQQGWSIFALRSRNGKQVWTANAGCSSPSIADGVVYEQNCSNDNAPTTSAFDAATGAFLWSNPLGAATGPYPPPIIANSRVYIVNATHQSFNIAAFQLP